MRVEGAPKPAAVFDVDGTIFKSSLLEVMARSGTEAGLFSRKSFDQADRLRNIWQNTNTEANYKRYIGVLVTAFVSEIQGVQVSAFEDAMGKMLGFHQARKFAFPRRLMEAAQPTHALVAITGSPTRLAKSFLQGLGIDIVIGSEYEVADGIFTGQATAVGDKAAVLNRLAEQGVIAQADSFAIGDTISDAEMLTWSSRPIMFNASLTLLNHGRQFCWPRINEVKDQITALSFDETIQRYVEIPADEYLAQIIQTPA